MAHAKEPMGKISRDELLLRLLKTPPQPRPKRERDKKSNAKRKPKKSTAATLILALLTSTVAYAQSSEEYAVMGKRAWAAFECSTLVDKSKFPDERQRLFDIGYEYGKAFIEAWQSNRVKWEDVSRHVPVDMLDKLAPWVTPRLPTADFRLGAIWESAASKILDRISKSDAPILFAMSEYDRKNCSLL